MKDIFESRALLKEGLQTKDIEKVKQAISSNMLNIDEFGKALVYAARHGMVDCINLFEPKINVEKYSTWYNKALEAAATGGHNDLVEHFNQKSTSSSKYQSVFRGAALGGHIGLMKIALKKGTFSKAWMSKSLETAAANGIMKTIKFLSVDEKLSSDAYFRAMKIAIENNKPEVVEFLKETAGLLPVFEKKVAVHAAVLGNAKIFKKLCNDSSLKEQIINEAFCAMSELKSEQMNPILFQKLLKNKLLLDVNKNSALVNLTVNRGHIELLKMLNEDAVITNRKRTEALKTAVLNSNLEIVEFFVLDERIDYATKKDAMNTAIIKGYETVARRILNLMKFRINDLSDMIELAAACCFPDIKYALVVFQNAALDEAQLKRKKLAKEAEEAKAANVLQQSEKITAAFQMLIKPEGIIK